MTIRPWTSDINPVTKPNKPIRFSGILPTGTVDLDTRVNVELVREVITVLHTTRDKKLDLLVDLLLEESEEVEIQVTTPRPLGRFLLLVPSNAFFGLVPANDGCGLASITRLFPQMPPGPPPVARG